MNPPPALPFGSATVSDDTCFRAYATTRDPAVLEALLRAHLPRALAQARRLLGPGPDAEDAVQEACLELVRTAARYDGTVPFGPWLGRLVHTACLRCQRARQRRARQQALPRTEVAAPAPEVQATRDEESLRQAIRALPSRDQLAISLHYFAACDLQATARALGLTANATAVRLHRIRSGLRQRLQSSSASDAAFALALATPTAPDRDALASLAQLQARLCQPGALSAAGLPAGPGAWVGAVLHVTQLALGSLATAALIVAAAMPLRLIAADAPPPAAAAPVVGIDAAGLARLQRPDGSWSDRVLVPLAPDAPVPPPTPADRATTALVALAFAVEWQGPSSPDPLQVTVARALTWLETQVPADGMVAGGSRVQALVTMALAEGLWQKEDALLLLALARGMDGLLRQRVLLPSGIHAWVDPSGEISTRTMFLVACCCRSTHATGLTSAADVGARDARQWLEATWRRHPEAPFPAAVTREGQPVVARGADPAAALLLDAMTDRAPSTLTPAERTALHAALVQATLALGPMAPPLRDTGAGWASTLARFLADEGPGFHAWIASARPALRAGVTATGAARGLWPAAADPDSLAAGPISASACALLMEGVFRRWEVLHDPTRQQVPLPPASPAAPVPGGQPGPALRSF